MTDLLPKALSEEETERLLGAVVGTGPSVLRDRALLEVLYGTGARVSEVVGLNLGDVADAVEATDLPLSARARQGRQGARRAARAAAPATPWPTGSPAQGRPLLEPTTWRRRSDAEAVFLNARGGRLTRVGVFGVVKKYAGRVGLADKVSPHVLRHSCATHMLGPGGRRPGGPGAPGPRLHRHDPALHQGVARAPPAGLRGGPSPGGNNRREGPRSMTRMPNEAPTAETADIDFAALLREEQAGLQAQLKELGFADQGSGLNYDSNFADSSQVTAERGEAERLATELREALDEVDAAIAAPGGRDLRHVRGLREADRRGPARGHAGRPLLHRRRRQALGGHTRSLLAGRRADGPDGPSAPCGSSPASCLLVALVAHHNITSSEIIIFCVIVPSIILHEVSHGVVANAFGDDTAKRAGRLTLNPVAARRPGRHAHRARPCSRWAVSASSAGPSRCR